MTPEDEAKLTARVAAQPCACCGQPLGADPRFIDQAFRQYHSSVPSCVTLFQARVSLQRTAQQNRKEQRPHALMWWR